MEFGAILFYWKEGVIKSVLHKKPNNGKKEIAFRLC
jgi:hypothetical protein